MAYERLTAKKLRDTDIYRVLDENGNIIVDRRLFERFIEQHNRLAELEDKIEQGTLIELPCKVGDTIWVVCGDISKYKITEFWYDGVVFNFRGENNEYVEEHKRFRFFHERIGKTVFLTREEAEKRLKELQNG